MKRAVAAHGIIFGAAWLAGFWAMFLIEEGAPARVANATLAGWWFAAYCSGKLDLSAAGAALAAVVYFVVAGFSILNGDTWAYHDAEGAPFLFMLLIMLAQAFFIWSPALFNAGVSWLFKKLPSFRH